MKVGKKIGVNVLMRASAKGGSGVYLYIPRDYANTYGIKSGDKVEVRLLRVFEEIPDEKTEKNNVVDLSRAKPKRKKKVKAT